MEALTGSYRLAAKENRERLARGLGWFSIGLGLAELLAPRALSKMIGVSPRTGLMRLLGLREIASGVGLLTQPEKETWLKSRVTGDMMDLGLLGMASLSDNTDGVRVSLATAAVAGVTALDVMCSKEYSESPRDPGRHSVRSHGAVHVKRSIVINRPAELLYQTWRNFKDLPHFMKHLIAVTVTDDRHSHWIAKGPAGSRVEWDAEIIEDRPNELISWRSLADADVDNAGSVWFERARGGRGTVVRVQMRYRPPAGKTGATMAKFLGQAPEKQLMIDLFRFKQMMETGEIARTEGQSAGRPRSTSRRFDELVRA